MSFGIIVFLGCLLFLIAVAWLAVGPSIRDNDDDISKRMRETEPTCPNLWYDRFN